MFDSRAVQKTEEAAAQVWNARGLSSLCSLQAVLYRASKDQEEQAKLAPQRASVCCEHG